MKLFRNTPFRKVHHTGYIAYSVTTGTGLFGSTATGSSGLFGGANAQKTM
jgi:hypothetical protein